MKQEELKLIKTELKNRREYFLSLHDKNEHLETFEQNLKNKPSEITRIIQALGAFEYWIDSTFGEVNNADK